MPIKKYCVSTGTEVEVLDESVSICISKADVLYCLYIGFNVEGFYIEFDRKLGLVQKCKSNTFVEARNELAEYVYDLDSFYSFDEGGYL